VEVASHSYVMISKSLQHHYSVVNDVTPPYQNSKGGKDAIMVRKLKKVLYVPSLKQRWLLAGKID
jgi:hypothetical protein